MINCQPCPGDVDTTQTIRPLCDFGKKEKRNRRRNPVVPLLSLYIFHERKREKLSVYENTCDNCWFEINVKLIINRGDLTLRPFFDKREEETEGKGGGWGPTFTGTRILPSQGPVCIDVDKSRTAINHRLSRARREREREKGGKFSVCIAVTVDRASSPPYLYHRLIMDHYPRALCSPVERTRRARIRIRGRIHGLFKGFSLSRSLSVSLSLSRARTRTRRRTDGVAREVFVVANPWSWHSFTAMRRNADARLLIMEDLEKGPWCPSR